MAVECEMDNTELITELLQALTNDVDGLKKWAKQVPTTPAPDYRAKLDQMASAIEQLRQQSKAPAPAVIDTDAISAQLTRIEQASRQRPEYRMSQYVKWGAYTFGIMVILLVVATSLAVRWKLDSDRWESSSSWAMWRLRYTKQANPHFYNLVEAKFDKEPDKVGEWIIQQEQADATREAAQKAQAQAAAMNAQADKLEGKKRPNGKKRT